MNRAGDYGIPACPPVRAASIFMDSPRNTSLIGYTKKKPLQNTIWLALQVATLSLSGLFLWFHFLAQAEVFHSRGMLLTIALGLYALYAALTYHIIGAFLKYRVQAISRTLKEIAVGGSRPPSPDDTADEIGELARQYHSIVSEISGKREAEEKRHREEITHIDRLATIGELLSGLAHEIRNPIAGISAAIQSLSRSVPAGDPAYPIYQEVRNNIDRLDTLVKSLLAYARMETPKLIPVNINDIIDQSLIIFESHAANGITIHKDMAGGLPLIDGDPKLLQQVMLNVFINAHQAKGSGLVLDIKTCFIPKGLIVHDIPEVLEKNPFRCQNGVIQVRISDNGPGIPDQLMRDIFHPFVTTKPNGTGLGLSISTRIVREHNGCLFAKNNPGPGTTIVMCLPAEQPAAAK